MPPRVGRSRSPLADAQSQPPASSIDLAPGLRAGRPPHKEAPLVSNRCSWMRLLSKVEMVGVTESSSILWRLGPFKAHPSKGQNDSERGVAFLVERETESTTQSRHQAADLGKEGQAEGINSVCMWALKVRRHRNPGRLGEAPSAKSRPGQVSCV